MEFKTQAQVNVSGDVQEMVDQLCQTIWEAYEQHPDTLPAEVTINDVRSGIVAKADEDGLYFEANGEEFDIEEFFAENNLQSDTLGIVSM